MKTFFAVFFAILAAVAVIYFAVVLANIRPGQNQVDRAYTDMKSIETQLILYESMNGVYPTTDQGLQALVTQPTKAPKPARWYQLLKEVPKDPWGNDYIYRCPGLKNPGSYDLFSPGPDRQGGTADDDWGSAY